MMKRGGIKLAAVAAATSLAVGGPAIAEPGKIGDFDIPGRHNNSSAGGGAKQKTKELAQVVVSQSQGSKVTSINQAMRLVKPGGTILVRGGAYYENVNVTKPVAIIGAPGDYGREPIIRASAGAPCMEVAPGSPVARVSIEKLIFEFDHTRGSAPCINISGGSVAVRDSAIMPIDADLPIRAAYGPVLPGLEDPLTRPARDRGPEAARRARFENFVQRHARPVGAANDRWDLAAGGATVQRYAAHASGGNGFLSGPAAGVRITAGEVTLDGNTIIGAQTAVKFESLDRALVHGALTNNVFLGNGEGIAASGRLADLLLTRNTIKFNAGPGVDIDARDGYGEVKILANLIVGNRTGILFSEKVRNATVNSNLVAQNYGDAMLMSSGFFGAVAGNTFAENGGCTVQFFSAQQKELNDAYIKVVAGQDFPPRFTYDDTNLALENVGDVTGKKRKRRKKKKAVPVSTLPVCAGVLTEG